MTKKNKTIDRDFLVDNCILYRSQLSCHVNMCISFLFVFPACLAFWTDEVLEIYSRGFADSNVEKFNKLRKYPDDDRTLHKYFYISIAIIAVITHAETQDKMLCNNLVKTRRTTGYLRVLSMSFNLSIKYLTKRA